MSIENHKIEYFFLQNSENSKYGRITHHFYFPFTLATCTNHWNSITNYYIIKISFLFTTIHYHTKISSISTKVLTKLTKLINIDIFINPHIWRHFSWLVQIRVQRPLQYKRLRDRSAKRFRRRIAKSISIIGV